MKQLTPRERDRDRETERQRDRETERDSERQRERRDRQTDRQTDRQRQTDSHKGFIFRKIIAFWLEKLHSIAEVFSDWYFLDQPLN